MIWPKMKSPTQADNPTFKDSQKIYENLNGIFHLQTNYTDLSAQQYGSFSSQM